MKKAPKSAELTVSEKFFCTTCKKFKGIPHQTYHDGDQVNYTFAVGGGHPAINRVGSIQSISGKLLNIATATNYIKRHSDDVTPLWAPTPLMYSSMGKCWCDIDPKHLPGGAT